MFSKIAINNVKRSFKDYFIYFITLTFAVSIFYSFNSIEAQNSMFEMGKSTSEFMATLNTLIAGASVFVAFILGGLIDYANNFLIKKRKRELGIYMTLGMSKGKISQILIIETIIIGLISLTVGVILGILVSQGLSIITAKLLVVNTSKYKFIISVSAVIKTTVCFAIMFLIVMILNQRTISKYKLIDMINASKKNEKIKTNNAFLSIVIFLLSVASLIVAYKLILNVGLSPENILFSVSVMLGIIGTLLFFFSLSNFFIHAIQKNKKVYFKDLNIFVLRQINNKINTNFIKIDNKEYNIKNEVLIKENIVTTGSYMDFFYLIVPDNFSGELNLHSTGFNVMFEGNDTKQSEEIFSNFLNDISENVEYSSIQVVGNTIELVNLRVYGSTTMIVFLGVYLGIVFLVSSAAVLALQQLSDISDSLDRYKSLKKIGVTDRLINKAILQQNLIYFMVPLALAIIHSIVGMIVINRIFSAYSSSIIGSSSLMISIALVIIYGGYFYATYVVSKNIVRNSN